LSSGNPSSTPFNSDQTITDYIQAGISAAKLVIGMPLYGRSFTNTQGPGAPFSGLGKGTWEPGIYDYKELPLPGAQIQTDHAIAASWSYDGSQRAMVSFDTPSITAIKTRYIRFRGLGGAMWWESSGDKLGNQSLISTVRWISSSAFLLAKLTSHFSLFRRLVASVLSTRATTFLITLSLFIRI
jgi:chitinase